MNKPKQEYCGCEIQNYAIFCHGCCKPVKPKPTGVGSIDVGAIKQLLDNQGTIDEEDKWYVAKLLATYFGGIVSGKDKAAFERWSEAARKVSDGHLKNIIDLEAQLAEVTKERDAFQTQAGARKKECFLLKKENEDLKHRWTQMGDGEVDRLRGALREIKEGYYRFNIDDDELPLAKDLILEMKETAMKALEDKK